MDFGIYRSAAELPSTGFMEIGPGKYSGKHWQDGFVFVWEDAFGFVEGIVARHFPDYGHFSINEVPINIGQRITHEWRTAAGRIREMNADDVGRELNLAASFRSGLDAEIEAHKEEIIRMLKELAERCEAFYQRSEWVCILGM